MQTIHAPALLRQLRGRIPAGNLATCGAAFLGNISTRNFAGLLAEHLAFLPESN
jgi:hypothetical protein